MIHPTLLASLALTTGLALGPAQGQTQTLTKTEIRVPGRPAAARVWSVPDGRGGSVPYYEVSLDGEHFEAAVATDYDLRLRYERFDPREREASVPASLSARAGSRLFIVQCWTQVLEDYRAALAEAGAEIHRFLANHSNVVEMSPEALERVRGLPFVRSVAPFHPAFKLEAELLEWIDQDKNGPLTVNLLSMRRGGQEPIIRWIEQRGGVVEHVSEPTYLMSATVDAADLAELAALDEVQWIDRWGPPENDMNRARDSHGADFVESLYGFTGAGVRVEVMDGGCDTAHPDMPDYLVHNGNSSSAHGTCTSGIVLGDGTARANARGAAPDAFLVIADYEFNYAGGNRYNHTAQLVNPAMPYQCVVQSNSWGSTLTTAYNSTSQDMDLILFDHDRISICQSQSNTGNQNSRPQAWAKNVISVGGVNHRNTTTEDDDIWGGGGSIGPAADGRLKPDVASFYDFITCADEVGSSGYDNGNYYNRFGGTSGATPIVAGHMVLLYQMWHEGLFGNPTPGATAFENAPFNTTAKALLINSASQWPFSGAGHDLTRTHQGWGHPDLERLSLSTAHMFVIDESEVLTELQSKSYTLEVWPAETEMRVTMVYSDPPGTTSSSSHRINNLDLKVVSPSNTTYHGNVGLESGLFSVSGGSPNNKDTVENVYVQSPEAGLWTVTVTAADVNQDSHLETGADDVDFALVVSGAGELPLAPPLAPSDLRGRAAGHGALIQFEDHASDEIGFEVERSFDGVLFTLQATLSVNDTKHFDTGLIPHNPTFYRVRAYNSAGVSAWSNTIKLLPKTERAGPP